MQWKIARRLSAVAAVFALALGAVLVLGIGSSATADSDGKRLEGTWRVDVTTHDCATGTPLLSFRAMLTFARGGTMTGTTASPAFHPGQRSPDHGVWSQTARRQYRAVSEAFILFDSPPPPLPLQTGTQRITQAIEMEDEDQWSSDASVEFFDIAGNLLTTGCASAVGHRFE